ncbi:MAG: hypothetical protein IIB83_03740 [Bacteroidetes bacterium]|nr:hypothetical protein [Bacteroidota bacterium]
MSNKLKKEYELLSAYLDGEVSLEQEQEIKNKLASSTDLRNKLKELEKLKKLTKLSFKQIPESPYFESVLNQKIKENKKRRHKLRFFAPAYGLAILTIIVILLLKFYPNILNNTLDNQPINIAGLYNSNLKPLLYTSNLSNEDIFNFAFYKLLPLDNNNKQYLLLSTDESGNEYFEIKKNNYNRRKNNLAKFAFALGLNDEQKNEVNSIIKVYRDELQEQILVNDKNTLALSQNLFDYNRALTADLLTFAAKANKIEFKKIIPAGLTVVNNKTTPIIINEIRIKNSGSTHQYVFFNEDTIFTELYTIDKEKFKKEIKIFKERVKENVKIFKNYSINIIIDSNVAKIKMKKYWNDGLVVFLDSNSFHVKLPVIPHFKIKLPYMDSLIIELDKARENFKEFSFSFPKNFPNFKGHFNFSDSIKDFNFDIHKLKIDSIMKNNFFLMDSLHSKNWYEYKFNDDSLKIILNKIPKMFNKFQWFNGDKEIKMLKKEMKELKKELKEMKKELRYSKKKIKT